MEEPILQILPENSDLRKAILMAVELRNEKLEEFIEKIKNGALEEDRAILQARFDNLLEMNENIKLLEDAAVLVYIKSE